MDAYPWWVVVVEHHPGLEPTPVRVQAQDWQQAKALVERDTPRGHVVSIAREVYVSADAP